MYLSIFPLIIITRMYATPAIITLSIGYNIVVIVQIPLNASIVRLDWYIIINSIDPISCADNVEISI